MIERLGHWDIALAAYLAPLMSTATFEWGRTDCALFVSDGVLAMTGADIAAAYRGRYSTALGSARALAKFGAGTLAASFDAILPERPVAYARRGDVVMSDGAVGLCIGAEALFMPEEGAQPGLIRIERPRWSRAWSI